MLRYIVNMSNFNGKKNLDYLKYLIFFFNSRIFPGITIFKSHLKYVIHVQKNANRKKPHYVNHYVVTKTMENILRPRRKT